MCNCMLFVKCYQQNRLAKELPSHWAALKRQHVLFFGHAPQPLQACSSGLGDYYHPESCDQSCKIPVAQIGIQLSPVQHPQPEDRRGNGGRMGRTHSFPTTQRLGRWSSSAFTTCARYSPCTCMPLCSVCICTPAYLEPSPI